jgi:hypothetical protein
MEKAVIKYQHKAKRGRERGRERVITASRIINIVYVECIKTALSLSYKREEFLFASFSSLPRHLCTKRKRERERERGFFVLFPLLLVPTFVFFFIRCSSAALFFCARREEKLRKIYQSEASILY